MVSLGNRILGPPLFPPSHPQFYYTLRYLDVAGMKNSKLYIYNGVALFLGWLVCTITHRQSSVHNFYICTYWGTHSGGTKMSFQTLLFGGPLVQYQQKESQLISYPTKGPNRISCT